MIVTEKSYKEPLQQVVPEIVTATATATLAEKLQ